MKELVLEASHQCDCWTGSRAADFKKKDKTMILKINKEEAKQRLKATQVLQTKQEYECPSALVCKLGKRYNISLRWPLCTLHYYSSNITK